MRSIVLILLAFVPATLSAQTKSSVAEAEANDNLSLRLDTLVRNYLPFTDSVLSAKANFIEPAEFIRSITDYRTHALELLTQQHPDTPSLQKDEIGTIVRYYTYSYMLNYGIDVQKRNEYFNDTANFKPNDTGMMRKLTAAMAAEHIENLSPRDLMRLDSMTWRGFEVNNGVLYQNSSKYRELIDDYLSRVVYYKPKYLPKLIAVAKQQANQYESKIDIVRGEITDPSIREALLYRFTRLLLETKGTDTSQYYTDYLRDAIDPVNAASIRGIHEKLEKYKAGSPAPEFVYPDAQGTPVALSGMKGHYVYIDVWATWCGPCKAELPFLKEVETKYEGQNIRFIGISVDEAKDADKWKRFVADNQLGGFQVMADHAFSSDFISNFNITAIPRFILIDPGGKIVSENASRPSNPALVVQLNKLLERP